MALEMMNKENLDNKINNEPLKINLSNTVKRIEEHAEKEYKGLLNEFNEVKKEKGFIEWDKNSSQNEKTKEAIDSIQTYLDIVKEDPKTTTYYINEARKLLQDLQKNDK